MKISRIVAVSSLLSATLFAAMLAASAPAFAGQVPGAASDPDIPISHRDRVYSAEQFSNTVSVTDRVHRGRALGGLRRGRLARY